jgi:hypothetical protein
LGQYREEIPLDNYKSIIDLTVIIDELIDKKLKKLLFDRHYVATVVSTPLNGKADIKLASGSNIITGVKIRNGLSVSNGDTVYLLAINGSLNNLIIDFKP